MNKFKLSLHSCVLLSILISGCGGGGSSPSAAAGDSTSPPATPVLSMTLTAPKTFAFSWSAIPGATSYTLLENPDGASGYSPIAGASNLSGTSFNHVVPLYKRINASYILKACNSGGCTDSAVVNVSGNLAAAIGYFKASNPDSGDAFGSSVALSDDGSTLAIGASGESSAATGINGNQADNSAAASGAVYVFVLSSGVWSQQAYIKASNAGAEDDFVVVSLSSDGNILAVGAYGESSAATGINGNQADNSALDSGAVYVFNRNGSAWSQQAYIKASNTHAGDLFGSSVKLSGDGNTLAVGALQESSAATGINGDETDHSAPYAGAVYMFIHSGSSWSQQSYIKASDAEENDEFGNSITLSDNGNTMVVGAHIAPRGGTVYVFERGGVTWSQQASLKMLASYGDENFGASVALSSDGNTLAVGAEYESSAATGINGDESDHSAPNAGAVYVFSRGGSTWSQQAYIKASNTVLGSVASFGSSVALSDDGNSLAVGARGESSAAVGINGNQADHSAAVAGAVYVFSRSGTTWVQQAYVKASNTTQYDNFGSSVALAGNGNILAVGAYAESSLGVGINGSQDRSVGMPYSGAVYLY